MLIEGSCSLRELQERGQCAAVFDCVRLAHHLHRAKNHLSRSTPISRLKWAGLENQIWVATYLGLAQTVLQLLETSLVEGWSHNNRTSFKQAGGDTLKDWSHPSNHLHGAQANYQVAQGCRRTGCAGNFSTTFTWFIPNRDLDSESKEYNHHHRLALQLCPAKHVWPLLPVSSSGLHYDH